MSSTEHAEPEVEERWEPFRYLHIERPDGAHAWHGPFDRPRALLGWLRLWATTRFGDGSPLVPRDATWSVSMSTQP